MNIFQIITSQLIGLLSLATMSGVVLHDTNVDKAFSTATYKTANSDMTDTNANFRAGSQPHTHAEHLSVKGRVDQAKIPPRSRERKRTFVSPRAQGYHGNGICMPLAGEWV